MSDLTRRKFIQLTVLSGATVATGLMSGCQGGRDEITGTYGGENAKILPYVNQPQGIQDGIPEYFATTCGMCPAGCGLFIRTIGGRAIKVEGNPGHPVNRGKTCALGQASLQHLYNPRRLRQPIARMGRNEPFSDCSWSDALEKLRIGLESARGKIAIIVDGSAFGNSPSIMVAIAKFAKTVNGEVSNFSFFDDSPWRAACREIYGRDQIPAYKIERADVMVAFAANFLEAWPSPVYYSRLYGEFRQDERRKDGNHGYFAYVGPRMSMTAANADEWLACNPGTEGAVSSALITALSGNGLPIDEAAAISGIDAKRILQLAERMKTAGARCLAMGGDGLLNREGSQENFIAVESLNALTKSKCVSFGDSYIPQSSESVQVLDPESLIRDLNSGRISTVLLIGQPNLVFALPSSLGVADALSKAHFVGALSIFQDESNALADVVLPIRSFLEDWSDNNPSVIPADVSIASLSQPVIDPQYILTKVSENSAPVPWMDTRPLAEILVSISEPSGFPLSSEEQLRAYWKDIPRSPAASGDSVWTSLLSHGGYWQESKHDRRSFNRQQKISIQAPEELDLNQFFLEAYHHIYWRDGNHAGLPWLQEIPDPMTSAVWNSWAEINLQTAMRMGIRTGDIVRITSQNGSIDIPAIPSRVIHPKLIAIPIGQGHTAAGYSKQGVNPLSVLDPVSPGSTRVHLEKIRSAVAGYHSDLNTLVIVQDMPNGAEPDAVKNLIHETARQART